MRFLPARPLAAAVGLGLAACLAAPALAQEPPPVVPDAWKYGRRLDESSLSFCVDPRDGSWQVQQTIMEAVAGALLLEPKVHVMPNTVVVQELDDVYGTLLMSCDLFLGFKLLPQAYPGWMTLTRPLYLADYVAVTADPDWQSLGDMPTSEAIGPAIGTSADLRLISYLGGLPADRRWRRFPMGSSEAALDALVAGTVGVAIVWQPELWALQKTEPAFAELRVIASDPLPTTTEGVGAALLSQQSFLRTAVDEAIGALIADGTIAGILEADGFPGRAP
jgi:polar amino acid transport system substrate-binding protein